MFDFEELWDESAAEHLSGRWACTGLFDSTGNKQTEYNVRKGSDGQLRFTSWRENGRLVSGILQPQGRWTEAKLQTVDGESAGMIRLAVGEEQGTIISNFQPAGSRAWGGDVAAHRPGTGPERARKKAAEQAGQAEWIGQEQEIEADFDGARPWKPVLWDLKTVSTWRQLRATPQWNRLAGRAALPLANEMSMKQFKARGVTGPFRALGNWELQLCREGLERFVAHCGGFVNSSNSLNQHVALPWLYHLVRHPRLVGPVAALLDTDDVLLFSSCMFLREPHSYMEHGVGWHQDGVLYEKVLSPMSDWVTVFVALSRCESENGCLQFVPPNFKTGFSTADVPFYPMELLAGELSVHSAKVTHRGGPNNTDERRDCLALRYISGRVRDTVADANPNEKRDWVVVCSGKAPHFRPVPEPREEMGKEGADLREAISGLRSVRYGTTTFKKPH